MSTRRAKREKLFRSVRYTTLRFIFQMANVSSIYWRGFMDESFPYYWRQRTFCGTWSIFDRLIVFVETSSMNDFFTVVNSENSWFWGISKLAYYEGISYRALSSCTASQFLTFDVKGFFTALDAFLTGYNFLLKLILRMIFSQL